MKLLGIRENCGTFTDRKTKEQVDYHNVMLYVSKEIEGKDVVDSYGVAVEEIKVKGAMLEQAFGGQFLGCEAYSKYIGTEIKVFYDNYKNCNYIVFEADKKGKAG